MCFLSGARGSKVARPMSFAAKDSFTVSAVGLQASSMKQNAASFKFQAATRDDLAKLYISREHNKLTPSRWSPGAIYEVKSSLKSDTSYSFGKALRPGINLSGVKPAEDLTLASLDSQKFKFPGIKSVLFGTEARDQVKNAAILEENPQVFFGRYSPGPAAYNLSVGTGDPTGQKGISFGHKTKILAADIQTPPHVGPGCYVMPEAVGVQSESTKQNIKNVKFSKAPRSTQKKSDQVLTNLNADIPAVGPQVSSKLANAAQIVFGSSTREHVSKTALYMTDLDKTDKGSNKLRLPHPILPLERDIVRYS